MQKKYELMVLVTPKASKAEYQDVIGRVRKLVAASGDICLDYDMGIKDLAYPIEHNDTGYYHVFNFHATGEKNAEINQELLHDTSVMRHLLIKIPNDFDFTVVMDELDKRKNESKEA
jgi:small subunit ribosomal protein S6